jgi:hypothetical protein
MNSKIGEQIVRSNMHSYNDQFISSPKIMQNYFTQGAGRARVEPHPGFTVDLFVTHTCAVGPTYTNAFYRESQVAYL